MSLENLAALPLASQDSYYELGRYLREHGPQMLHSAQDPTNLALGGAALLGTAAAALIAPRLVGPIHP